MRRDPFSLDGKLVLVTGSGTGIGQGVALGLARQGADVVVHYSNSARGALEAVEQITSMGRRAVAVKGDLGKVEDCRRIVDEAVAFLGGLDGLVNNAGVTATIDFQDVTEEQFDRIYNINIRGEFFCAQRAFHHMLERGRELRRQSPDGSWAGGSIVNISSVHGLVGCPGHSVYAGTKGAINAFSRELAVELCPAHVRVNVVAPGSVEVASYWNKLPEYDRKFGDSLVPWGRVGLPEDIAHLVAFLISDAGEWITGQVIYPDGGLTAKMALPIQPPTTA